MGTQYIVKLNGPIKSQLCLKTPKEKYIMHLTPYDLIFKIKKISIHL